MESLRPPSSSEIPVFGFVPSSSAILAVVLVCQNVSFNFSPLWLRNVLYNIFPKICVEYSLKGFLEPGLIPKVYRGLFGGTIVLWYIVN